MTTVADRSRLRRDVGADETSLPDETIDELFVEAAETYPDSSIASPYVRVLALQGLLASSAKLTTYRQNQTSENASDVFAHLQALLKLWESRVRDALVDAGWGAVRGSKRLSRVREYPDG